jgi:hypothetical protein
MQLRERASVVLELVAVVAVTATVWIAQPRDRAPHHAVWIDNRGGCVDRPAMPAFDHPGKVEAAVVIEPRLPDPTVMAEPPLPKADALYRRHDFDAAAHVARAAARRDARFKSVAELYIQFAHAWTIGADRAERPIARFEALREARKLDVVLGGVYADELDAMLVYDTPRAAIAYTAEHRYQEAAVSVSVGDALGIGTSESLKAVRQKLLSEHVRL